MALQSLINVQAMSEILEIQTANKEHSAATLIFHETLTLTLTCPLQTNLKGGRPQLNWLELIH